VRFFAEIGFFLAWDKAYPCIRKCGKASVLCGDNLCDILYGNCPFGEPHVKVSQQVFWESISSDSEGIIMT
jgi:hypothetical protein